MDSSSTGEPRRVGPSHSKWKSLLCERCVFTGGAFFFFFFRATSNVQSDLQADVFVTIVR